MFELILFYIKKKSNEIKIFGHRFKNVKYKYLIILITCVFFRPILFYSIPLLLNIFFHHSKILWVWPRILILSQSSSFSSSHKHFVSRYFISKKKNRLIPASEILRTVFANHYHNKFGINAIFHKNAIENS